jgi:hypothetical protein
MAVKESKTSLYNGIAPGFPAPGTLPEPGLVPATLPVSLVVRGARDRHGAPVTMNAGLRQSGRQLAQTLTSPIQSHGHSRR